MLREGWAKLDYPGASLQIQATTKWEAGFRANACSKEPWTVAWLESMQPGDVLWNVGANVGSYALIAASRGNAVVAIEPAYPSFAALCNNILANSLEHLITPLCLAAANGRGITPLAYRSLEAGAASHACGEAAAPKTIGTLPTLALPLDLLCQLVGVPAPTHLLVDVDGVEAEVLAGAQGMLAQQIQSVMIEVQAGTDQEKGIGEIMQAVGHVEQQRFDRRGGVLMAGIHYSLYARQPVASVPAEPVLVGAD